MVTRAHIINPSFSALPPPKYCACAKPRDRKRITDWSNGCDQERLVLGTKLALAWTVLFVGGGRRPVSREVGVSGYTCLREVISYKYNVVGGQLTFCFSIRGSLWSGDELIKRQC